MTESSESNSKELDETKNGESKEIPKKMKFGMKIKLAFQAIKPILTSHHPLCEQYNDHTFHLFGREWCIGCYIGYPSGALMLIIGYLTGLFQSLEVQILFLIGGILMCTYILSVVGLTRIRWIKILSKVPLGAGAAFVVAGFFKFSFPIWASILLSFLLLQVFITIINIKRGFEMKKTCAECEYKSDHNNCPGMHPIMEGLNKIKKKKK